MHSSKTRSYDSNETTATLKPTLVAITGRRLATETIEPIDFTGKQSIAFVRNRKITER